MNPLSSQPAPPRGHPRATAGEHERPPIAGSRCAGVRGLGGEPADRAYPRVFPALRCAVMATFAVKFLGCKVSQADARLARGALLDAGHTEAPEDEAELHVINTCCITSEAEAKSRQSVRRSLRGDAAPGGRQVFVSGCAANLRADQFAEIDPRVRPF